MATPYSEIKTRFLNEIVNPVWMKLPESEKNTIIYNYMFEVCSDITYEGVDLTDRNDTLEQFNETLPEDLIILIVSDMIILYELSQSPIVYTGTPYSTLRLKFLRKIKDYDLPALTDSEKNDTINGYIFSACVQFKKCKIDLTDRDNLLEQFNNILDDEIIEILSEGMIVEHLKPNVYNSDNMANFLNTKDLSVAASPANILKENKNTLEMSRKEFIRLMRAYTYNNANVSDLS